MLDETPDSPATERRALVEYAPRWLSAGAAVLALTAVLLLHARPALAAQQLHRHSHGGRSAETHKRSAPPRYASEAGASGRRRSRHARPAPATAADAAYADPAPSPFSAGVDQGSGEPRSAEIIASGTASWYSESNSNRRTSSGERFDETAMTAAHPWLPLGTRVRVTLESTGESVVVTINDRQGSRSRVIDLSKGAARQLGILSRGTARVTLSRA